MFNSTNLFKFFNYRQSGIFDDPFMQRRPKETNMIFEFQHIENKECCGQSGYLFQNFMNSTNNPNAEYIKEIGRSSWRVLHAVSDSYPELPNAKDKLNMINFINSFADLYPCDTCRIEFKNNIKKYPPNVQTRKEIRMWMCEFHNNINQVLGKNVFDCKKL